MTILVTGGAGYIGSHTAHLLVKNGYNVVVLDNLSSGHRWAVPEKAHFIEGSFGDTEVLTQLFSEHSIDAVLHFAAYIEVEESTRDPLKYYANNTVNATTLLKACLMNKVSHFIFSSTAATYGEPENIPINESEKTQPINPYGNSKLCTETILRDVAAANKDLSYVILRYFNVAGANGKGHIGQTSERSTHLIKIASEAATGKRSGMKIYGDDYPTPDGTCIRDYIHVDDLAQAHIDALLYLKKGGSSDTFNCGYGHGYSVKEVIEAVKAVSEEDFPVGMSERRPGDPPQLIADNTKIKQVLNWTPQFDDLKYICKTAINWEKKLQDKNL